ncbi:MAG: HAD family hydrolase [Clostridia bacterium]|nr:HAD family hydrolase [Clostridia bacterium]
MYKYLLFDLDGTLTDPSIGITNSVAYALSKFGINVEDKRTLYKFIGPPLVDAFSEYYGFSKEDSEKATAFYRETFSVKGLFENRVYDGVVEMLEALKNKGKRLIIATSKPEPFTMKILKHFDLLKYFDFVAAATFDASRNSKDKVIAYALQSLDIKDKSEVVMIGDRHHDIDGAKENGIDSIGVLWGFGSREELETSGATHIAESVQQILKYV